MRRSNTPTAFAALDVLALALLAWLPWPYARNWGFFSVLNAADPLGGVLPLIVPWAGAIGGLTVSLVGAAKHSHDWDDRWNIWHACRPVVGAVAGTVAFVIVVLVLRSAGGLAEGDKVPDTPDALALFATIAFAAGFRDWVFFALVAKVLKVIFANGDQDTASAAVLLSARELDFGTAALGAVRQDQIVRVTVTAGEEVTLANWYEVIDGGGAFTAASPDPGLLRGSYRDLVVSFAPPQAGAYEGRIRVAAAGHFADVSLRGSAR